MDSLTSAADIKRAILHNAGELIDGTSPYDASAMKYQNDAYKKVVAGASVYGIQIGEIWDWAKSPTSGVIVAKTAYSAGLVTVTNESANVTFDTPPSYSMAGFFFVVTGRPEVFRILTHTASSGSAVLDSVYTDATGAGLQYLSIPLEYTIGTTAAPIMRLTDAMTTYKIQSISEDEGKIYGLEMSTMKKKYPLHRLKTGIPTNFTRISEAQGIITVRFNKYPDADTRIEYDWVPPVPTLIDDDASIPIIPAEHRCVLEYLGTYRVMLDKEDSRSQSYLDMGQAQLASMQAAKRKDDAKASANRGRMVPRLEEYSPRRTWPIG